MLAATCSGCKGSPAFTGKFWQIGLQNFAVFGDYAHAGQLRYCWRGGLGFRSSLGVRSCSPQSQAKKENRLQPIVPPAFHALYNTDEA